MTTEAALLAAVLACPEDDAPRLIFADWLDENGQSERSEFIRVQCRIAAWSAWAATQFMVLPESAEGRRIEALRRRERELLDVRALGVEGLGLWCYRVDGMGGAGQASCGTFRRGFVAAVICSAADWLAHGDAITAAQPVEEVTLTTWPDLEYSGESAFQRRHMVALQGRREQTYADHPRRVEELLRMEWSRVKVWHLPTAGPGPQPSGPVTTMVAGEHLGVGEFVVTDGNGRARRARPGERAPARVIPPPPPHGGPHPL